MKILTIVGARPQFIKLSSLSRALKGKFYEVMVHTGQHYDHEMSEIFYKELRIPKPKYNLNIGSCSPCLQVSRMILEIGNVIEKEKPEAIVVFGDTNTTLAGAIAASKKNIKIAHVEAGLRSFNKLMPEEMNRILTDHASDMLFAPTLTSLVNLQREGLYQKSFLTGDIMVDSLMMNLKAALKNSKILNQYNLNGKQYYLLTLHRPYNVDNELVLSKILMAISSLDQKVIFPIHPRTKKVLKRVQNKFSNKIQIIDPVGYFDFLTLQSKAERIYTDSGGIQKEAYILKKQCITLRPETEWTETLENHWNRLVDPNSKNFFKSFQMEIKPLQHKPIFGNNVANTITKLLKKITDN